MTRAVLATVAFLAANAAASVSFMPDEDAPGGYYFFTVAKLYNFNPAMATSRLEMTLPNGLWMAVPEDHPGWQPTVTQRTVPEYIMHGRPTTTEPGKIVWQAAPGHQLGAGQHAQFGLQLKLGCTFNSPEFHALPAGAKPRLYFPTREVLSDLAVGDGLGEDLVVENFAVPDSGSESGGHHTRSLARNIELAEWSHCPNETLSWFAEELPSPAVQQVMGETQVRSVAAAEVALFNGNLTDAIAEQATLAEATTELVSQASGKIGLLEALLVDDSAGGLTSSDPLFVTAAVFSFFGTSVFVLTALLRVVSPSAFRSVFVPIV